MGDVYATRADLYRYGLPRGKLANPGRLCASVSALTDLFELDGHGLETDLPILFRAEAGGQLPDPIVEGVTYRAIRVSDSTFKAADVPGGPPIDLTTDGVSVLVATELPIDETLERYSRHVDGFLPAHCVPLQPPYPVNVVAIVAELAAKKLTLIHRQSSEQMDQMEIAANAQLTRWAKGLPLRDRDATAAANLAISAAVHIGDPKGSAGNGGTIP